MCLHFQKKEEKKAPKKEKIIILFFVFSPLSKNLFFLWALYVFALLQPAFLDGYEHFLCCRATLSLSCVSINVSTPTGKWIERRDERAAKGKQANAIGSPLS
jgi:hypothetical protein